MQKLIGTHRDELKEFLMKLVDSDDPRKRRLASESLRPVSDNRWIHGNPQYSLSILRHLFGERDPYPRSSVGNNLSDLSKRDAELVFGIVKELVATGDKNSHWIARRACRNLVKKEPLRVMDLLGCDEYRYKKKRYRREDFE